MKKTGQEVKGHVQPLGGSVNTASGSKNRITDTTSGAGLRTGTKGGKGNSGPSPKKGFRSTGQENGGGGYAG